LVQPYWSEKIAEAELAQSIAANPLIDMDYVDYCWLWWRSSIMHWWT